MRSRLFTICFVLILILSLCAAKGGGGGSRGSSSSSGSRSSSSSSSRYSSSSSSGYYSSSTSSYRSTGGYYYSSYYYRSSSGLSNGGSCDKTCGVAVGSVIGGLIGLFLLTWIVIMIIGKLKQACDCSCDCSGCFDCCDGSSSSSNSYGGSSYGGSSGAPSKNPDVQMMTEVKIHTSGGEVPIPAIYSNSWMDPDCKPESLYNGKYHEAPKDAFVASNEFNRQFPPQNVLPPPDHIQWIATQGGAAWKFGPDIEATWRVQRRTRAEDDGRFIVFENSEDAMMQTNYPFFCPTENPSVDTLNASLFYYEVTIVSKRSSETVVAVGLATKPYPAYRLPGWNLNSVGYHSDDGHKFLNDGYGGQSYGPTYGAGDVIGIGYNPGTGNVFFTKNGKHLGDAFRGQMQVFFPCVGSDGHAELKINFGDNPEVPYSYSDANGYGPGGLYKNFPAPSNAPSAPAAHDITL